MAQFELLDGGVPEPGPAKPKDPSAGLSLIILGLKALSQRALVAVADLFMLATVLSAWWLWTSIPDPSTHQLVGLGLYGALVLAANWIVRKVR